MIAAIRLGVFLAFGFLCFRVIRFVLVRFQSQRMLTPPRFALTFALGIAFLVTGMFLLYLFMSSASFTRDLLLLGLSIAALNALLAYPIGLLAFRYLLRDQIDSTGEDRRDKR